ncbi:ABC transporter permease [Pelotomaculum propionicicum]|uniref:Oligopeptide transport system permease protein OppC n=1 Tax=Pelotomaculum propionicicum TaxID=258475 RepID=A0A4Y7RJW5_9FIRM|nr:ABC transporter permease [Pelotomaculum propionicicum]NLI12474.1 ABC transporter permease [Peptococcaceae bacterium]TEB09284.1 Oligopeptide transport system permease protein OppC [Pelotomaculum propionicicum]
MEIKPQMFQPLPDELQAYENTSPPAHGYWKDVWSRFKKHKLAMTGLIIIGLLVLMSVIGPCMSGHTYYDQDLSMVNRAPNSIYWFGTDALGRDLFTRVWWGARISLFIGLLTSVTCLVIGVLYGGISGYLGGRADEIMMRLVEVLLSIPFLLYVILLIILFEPGLKAIFLALGLVCWLNMARIVRGQVLSLKEREYVLAARLLGISKWRILSRHLIPNAMGPIIVTATLLVPEAIFTEAFLSFLGLGVSSPQASWGVLASEGMHGLRNYPWQLFFPAFLISLTMFAFNFVGDGLRDAMDPRGGLT